LRSDPSVTGVTGRFVGHCLDTFPDNRACLAAKARVGASSM
jgi:hypothetical protein